MARRPVRILLATATVGLMYIALHVFFAISLAHHPVSLRPHSGGHSSRANKEDSDFAALAAAVAARRLRSEWNSSSSSRARAAGKLSSGRAESGRRALNDRSVQLPAEKRGQQGQHGGAHVGRGSSEAVTNNSDPSTRRSDRRQQQRPRSTRVVHTPRHEDLPDYRFHVFYYPWYRNLAHDGGWKHWNHPFLPHWEQSVTDQYPKGRHVPPDDIGSSYYPELGPYSSADPAVLATHMKQIRSAGIGVVVLSWYPRTLSDPNGEPSDRLTPAVLDAAQAESLRVAFHSEPYDNRTEVTFVEDLKYIVAHYGSHPALFRTGDPPRPVVYVYDPYHVSYRRWGSIFRPSLPSDSDGDGPQSIRGTAHDAFVIGLYLKSEDMDGLLRVGHFDALYSYFASRRFSEGSDWDNWRRLVQEAHPRFFVPSVSPGYDDLKVRPWNGENVNERADGAYYNESMQAALNAVRSCSSCFVSITSWNEWGEGTQIEPAASHISHQPRPALEERLSDSRYSYRDYSPFAPDYYLRLTRHWIDTAHRRHHSQVSHDMG